MTTLPGAVETNRVSGINDHGCMVGVYTGMDGQRHGFEASSREAHGAGDEAGKNGGSAQMDFHEDDCNQQRRRSSVRRLSVLTSVLETPRSICRHSGSTSGCPRAKRSSTEAST